MKNCLSLKFDNNNLNHQEIVDRKNTDFIFEFYNNYY